MCFSQSTTNSALQSDATYKTVNGGPKQPIGLIGQMFYLASRGLSKSGKVQPTTLGGNGITTPTQTPDDVLYTKGQQVTGNPWRGSQGSVVRR